MSLKNTQHSVVNIFQGKLATTVKKSIMDKTTQQVEMKPEDVNFVIYHRGCEDGFGAAFCVWKYFKLMGKNVPSYFDEETELADGDQKIQFYGSSPNRLPPTQITGKNVLICDMTYKKPVILEMLKQVKNLLILDHHASAQKDLEDIPACNKRFDMGHSGVYLTYKYFFPTAEVNAQVTVNAVLTQKFAEPTKIPLAINSKTKDDIHTLQKKVPLLVQYIEDKDLWAKKLPQHENFFAWFFTVPKKFEEYDKYLDEALFMSTLESKGPAYSELNNFYIKNATKYSVIRLTQVKDKFYFVVYANTTILVSEIGNSVLKPYTHADFSAIYGINEKSGTTHFSLRSENHRANVSEVATVLGGGGHPCASGVILPGIVSSIGSTHGDIKLYDCLETISSNVLKFREKTLSDKKDGDNSQPEIKVKSYNIVYVHSPTHKYEMGNYLLQMKRDKQNAQHILDSKNSASLLDFEKPTSSVNDSESDGKNEVKIVPSPRFDVAAVWSYNPIYNKTVFHLFFDKKMSEERMYALIRTFKLGDKMKLVVVGRTPDDKIVINDSEQNIGRIG